MKVEYWDCGNKNHRHKTEDVARLCMKRSANKKLRQPQEVTRARYIHAAREIVNGATYKAAGESIGVGDARAQQILRKVFWAALHPNQDPGEPPCHYNNIAEVRKHKDYWLDRIDKVAAHWGVQIVDE